MYPANLWLFVFWMTLISMYDTPKFFPINGWSTSLHVGLSWLWALPQLWLSWTLRLTCPTPTANQLLPVSCHGSPEHTRGDTFAYHQLTCRIQSQMHLHVYTHKVIGSLKHFTRMHTSLLFQKCTVYICISTKIPLSLVLI